MKILPFKSSKKSEEQKNYFGFTQNFESLLNVVAWLIIIWYDQLSIFLPSPYNNNESASER